MLFLVVSDRESSGGPAGIGHRVHEALWGSAPALFKPAQGHHRTALSPTGSPQCFTFQLWPPTPGTPSRASGTSWGPSDCDVWPGHSTALCACHTRSLCLQIPLGCGTAVGDFVKRYLKNMQGKLSDRLSRLHVNRNTRACRTSPRVPHCPLWQRATGSPPM